MRHLTAADRGRRNDGAVAATVAAIAERLEGTRRRTFALYAPLDDEAVCKAPDPIMSPPVWDLGHIGAYEELWSVRRLAGGEALHPELDAIYDAFETPRAVRGEVEILPEPECRRFLELVRARASQALGRAELTDDAPPLTARGFVFDMVAAHEAQHTETVPQGMQMLPAGGYLPPSGDAPAPPPRERAAPVRVRIPGGAHDIGTGAAEGFAYDCERPAHGHELGPFLIARHAVTEAEWREFVRDREYARPEPWSAAGWEWRNATAAEAPAYWSRDGEGGLTVRRFERFAPPSDARTVCHVGAHEADAFARWGRRAPSERGGVGDRRPLVTRGRATGTDRSDGLRPRARCPRPRRGLRGDDRRRLGVDVFGLRGVPGVPGLPLSRVRGGLLRRWVPRAPRRVLGDPAVGPVARVPEPGSTPTPSDLRGRAARLGRDGCPRVSRASAPAPPPFRLDVRPGAAAGEMAADVRAGLSARPKVLPPKYFSDARGSELYERITELPEYYQARAEAEILGRVSAGLIRRHRPDEPVEIGLGSSRKTEAILEAMARRGGLRYLPFDVCAEMLLSAGERLVDRFRGPDLHGVAGDFNLHMDRVPAPDGRRMVAFLGGTVGNLDNDERSVFMERLARLLAPGDLLLLGTDLQGDPERIRIVYDDAEGVTAEFNRNVLHALNRELEGHADVDGLRHVARYDHAHHRVGMRVFGRRAPIGSGTRRSTWTSTSSRGRSS